MENKQSLDYAEMRSELSALRGDINNLDRLVSRLDTAIDKITDVSANINKMLAIHDHKLETHALRIDQLVDADRERRIENDKKLQEILDKIVQIKDDMRTHITSSNKEITNEFEGKVEDLTEKISTLKAEIDSLHQWKWMMIGGSVVVGWVISKMNWVLNLL